MRTIPDDIHQDRGDESKLTNYDAQKKRKLVSGKEE